MKLPEDVLKIIREYLTRPDLEDMLIHATS